MKRPLIAAVVWLALCPGGTAFAGEPPPKPADSSVEMSPIGLPVVVDGQLVNYVFVTLRLQLSPSADSNKVRMLEPYLRDSLVRAAGRTPFVRPDNYAALDDARLIRAVMSAGQAAAGPGAIVAVKVVREQAQHYQGLPKPAGKSASR